MHGSNRDIPIAMPEKAQPRILIIEDNTDDQLLLIRQLSKAGLAQYVIFFQDGAEAWAHLSGCDLENNPILAVFLDLNLPVVSGLELLKNLRSRESTRRLPVIVMTSSTDRADLALCQELKVSSYVTKPVTSAAFTKAIADTFHSELGICAHRRESQDQDGSFTYQRER